MPERTVIFTENANTIINDMRMHVNNIGLHYGLESKFYRNAATSFMNVLSQMINLGGKIYGDGDLNLYCVTTNIEYGVNFHPCLKDVHDGYPIPGTWSINS